MVMKLGVMNHTPRQKPTMWRSFSIIPVILAYHGIGDGG
jgi:hypothetical protein